MVTGSKKKMGHAFGPALFGFVLAASVCACNGGAQGGGGYGETSDDAYSAGKRLQGAGDLPEAAKAFRASIALNPRFVWAHFDLALTLRDMGDQAEALAEAEKTVEIDPNMSGAQLMLAELSLEQGSPARALEAADAAIKIEAELADAHLVRGLALEALGRPEDALQTYKVLLDLSPGHRRARLRSAALSIAAGGDEAIRELRRYVEQAPNDPEGYVLLGRALMGKGSHASAIELMTTATRIDGDHAEIRWILGRAYLADEQSQLAIIELQRAVEINPKLADALVALGEAELSRGFDERAMDYAGKALALNPSELSAFMLKANVFEDRRQLDKMEGALREAIGVRPLAWAAILKLGRRMMSKGRASEVLELVRGPATHEAAPLGLFILGADAAKASGDLAGVVRYLKRALSLGGDNVVLGRYVAACLGVPDRGGESMASLVDMADRHYQSAAVNDVGALLLLVGTYVASGDTEKARQILEAAGERLDDPRIDRALKDL